MNILTDILSLWKRKKFVTQAFPEDVLVLGVNTEPEIEGIASPIPYKDVKLIKISDFVDQNSCQPVNLPVQAPTLNAGVFKDKTTDPLTGECYINFRRLKSVSLNLSITENGDFIDFDVSAATNTSSNVGGGVEVYQSQVGVDFQFRTFTSVDGSVTITQNLETIDLSVNNDFGIWSLTDAAGLRTFYDWYEDAALASVSGDTIHMHANVVIDDFVSNPYAGDQILRNGVDINLNGFTYTNGKTDTSSAFIADNHTRMTIYDGVILRTNSAVTGGVGDTFALDVIETTVIIECKSVKFLNNNGYGCRVNQGTLIGADSKGSEGGIINNQFLKNSIGEGVNKSGIVTAGGNKNAGIYDCTGISEEEHGIWVSGMQVQNCIGRSFGGNEGHGAFLESCTSINITGYSASGSGIVVSFGSLSDSVGETNSNVTSAGLFEHAGIVLYNAYFGQNLSGHASLSNTVVDVYGISFISTGDINDGFMKFLNCSGLATGTVSTGAKIILNNSIGIEDMNMSFNNCSFSGELRGCIVDNSPAGTSQGAISLLNCSFITDNDIEPAIKGVGTVTDISYANCTFRTGNNSLIAPLDAVTQAIANTFDNQGNIHV